MADDAYAASTATPRNVPRGNASSGMGHPHAPAWPLSSSLPQFGALLSAPRMARAHLRSVLALWGLSRLTDQAEYVVSELVANAVNASTRDDKPIYDDLGHLLTVGLALRTDTRLLRIEVWDRADGVPIPKDARDLAESGRGLGLIACFSADRWGWTARDQHGWKHVYAVLGPDPVQEPGQWLA